MPNKSAKSAGGDWMSRMPAKGKVIRKLRGKTRTHVEKGMRTVSLFPPRRGPEGEIVGTISVSVLKRFGLNKPTAIFDYVIVRKANGRPAVVLKPVKPKKLSKRAIDRIKREVDRDLEGLTEL